MQRVEFFEAAYQSLVEYDLRRSFLISGPRYEIKTYAGVKENRLGYDLEVCALVPLYLQLKVSHFYPAFTASNVLVDRKRLGISDNPGCYGFALHPDKKSRQYKQHNLLAELHAGGSYARYIAPLFHTMSDLEHLKYHHRPPHWGPSAMGLIDGNWYDWRNYVTFDHSISILPHKAVSDSINVPHKYTYSNKHHVCFHSEAARIPDGRGCFSDINEHLSSTLSLDPTPLATINGQIAESLMSIEGSTEYPPKERKRRQNQTQVFYKLARTLKRRYGIDCILVSKRG